MQVILLVVVGAINQSKYVPMMSLAVVGTLTNQILLVYTGVYVGLHGSMRVYVGVYAGLHGGLRGSTRVCQDFMLIRLFNASDLIGCGGGH